MLWAHLPKHFFFGTLSRRMKMWQDSGEPNRFKVNTSSTVGGFFTTPIEQFWLVVSTHLKNISQIGNLPQIGVKIKNI